MREINKSADTKRKNERYKNIISLSYPRSEIEADFPDSVLRAAQFAPFEALTGHDDAINEAARSTDAKRFLDEYAADELEARLRFLISNCHFHPEIRVTYFSPDSKKTGGKYKTVSGTFMKIKEYERLLLLSDGTEISTLDIIEVEGEIFNITD